MNYGWTGHKKVLSVNTALKYCSQWLCNFAVFSHLKLTLQNFIQTDNHSFASMQIQVIQYSEIIVGK